MNKIDKFKIISADSSHLELLVPLFDAYRVFYEQPSDLSKASDFLTARLKHHDSMIFLATDQSESLGYGFTQLYPSFTSVGAAKIIILNDLFVNPEHRRLNIACELMNAAKDYALKNTYLRIILQTTASNKGAQKLYESQGYKKSEDNFLSYSLELKNDEHETHL